MSWIGYLVVAACGFLLGIVAFLILSTRRRPAVPGTAASPEDAIAAAAFNASTTGYAVLNADGHVLVSNTRARELGVVRAGMADRRILEAAQRAAVADEPVDVELGPGEQIPRLGSVRRGPLSVQAVVRTMDGLVLVSAADETEALRVEAVRRDFVANVSHELKTPVSAIGLLAEAVLDGYDEPEHVKRFAEKLLRESVRLGALVNELITLSRLQGADPLPDLAVLEVDAVIAEATARSAIVAETAGTTITTDQPSGLLVMGDRPMLVTAVVNLLANAVHYSPAGTSVSVSRGLRNGKVEVSVTDRGIGIAPELQARVFERFFRIDPARSRATGGTGLGLAIVKHVAANHGGTAELWSRPGTGSTFTLRLPAFVADSPAAANMPVAPNGNRADVNAHAVNSPPVTVLTGRPGDVLTADRNTVEMGEM